jgi:hypothetical protein
MALLTRTRRWVNRHGIGHVKHPIPKHVENSDRGDLRAKRQGKRSNDLDLQMTMADPECPYVGHPEHVDGVCHGHVVNTHWLRALLRDGFRDPLGRIPRHKRVDRLTLRQVLRLRAGRWPRRYRIRTIERALRHCARVGIVAVLEPKGDPRFRQDWVWEYIFAVAEDVGCTIAIRALPENAAALPVARRVAARSGQHVEAWEI